MARPEREPRETPATDAAPSRPGLGRRIAVVVASFALATLMAECALRLAAENPYREERPDWVLPLALHHLGKALPVDRSALDANDPIAVLRTDDRAYLEPSRRFAEPDVTVAFLGGSTTECSALDGEQRWPALVSLRFEEQGLRVNALNAGRSGNTSHDAVNLLFNHVVQDRPDVAVLMEAANDFGVIALDPEYRTRSGAPMTARLPLRWLLQSASAHSALAGALRHVLTVDAPRAGGFERAQQREGEGPPVAPFEQRLRAFVGVCRAFGVVPVLMTQPFAPMKTALTPEWTDARDQERFNDAIRRVAEAEGVALVDLARHVRETVPEWDRPMHVFYDGIHVTARGAEIYADYVTARLREEVPRLRTAASAPPAAAARSR